MTYIFSQILAVVVFICVLVMFQCKSKGAYLFWVILANTAYTLSFTFLSDWVGTGLMAVATLRAASFFVLEKKRARTPQWLAIFVLLLFWAAHVVTTALTWEIWFDWVLLGGALCVTYSGWVKGKMNLVRAFNVVYSSLIIVHNIRVNNWVAIAVEASVILSIAAYYFRKLFRNKSRCPAAQESVTIGNEQNI